MQYPYKLKELEDHSWIGVFTDFPQLLVEGSTPDEVRVKCKTMLSKVLHVMLQNKENVPQPSYDKLGDELVLVPPELIPVLRAMWISPAYRMTI
jgi:predicted RNase H-like HicB family nuclease